MQITVGTDELKSMVMGTSPYYSKINEFENRGLGSFSGSYDRWSWNYHKLDTLSETELYDLYVETNDSWK